MNRAVQERGVLLLTDLAVPVDVPAVEAGPGTVIKFVGPAETSLAEPVLLVLGDSVLKAEMPEGSPVIDGV